MGRGARKTVSRNHDILTAESIYRVAQIRAAREYLAGLPKQIEIPSFSEWAAEHRFYPPGISVYPGKHDPETAPHMNEILDRLHPDDPCTHVYLMKSVQSTATTMSENAIGASIQYKLWSMLYLTADQSLAKIRSSSNIDPMIDHSGLGHLVKPISERMKRKTADNTYYKEFTGGIKLAINSYNSIGALKSNTTGFIVCDEWDEAPPELKGQGDIQGIIEGRTMGLRRYKILFISTPSMMQTSRIYKGFLEGDQRYYYVPCPLCGEKQVLQLKGAKDDHGLTFTTQTDAETGNKILIPETVRYICKYCHEEFGETKKQWMLSNGEWRPTSTPIDRRKTSYHVSGLLSPEMFLSWERICQQFINTDFGEDLLKFKDFVINYKGWPWAMSRKIQAWEEFRDRADDYCLGEVPEGKLLKSDAGDLYQGPLLLYAGADVQGDRIELHVVGFGPGMETWSIDYQVFTGNTADLEGFAWGSLHEWVYNHTYKILGKECRIILCAIDCGWDPRKSQREKDFVGKANIVYDFVARRTDRFIATMGVENERGLELLREARINEANSLLKKRYNVFVSMIKELISYRLELDEGPGAVHFPRYMRSVNGGKEPIPDEHYRRFLSERYQETEPKKFGWVKIYKRNEPWDNFIYAYAAAEFNKISALSNQNWHLLYLNLINNK
jgi:phage terminase large subunit GpA-like protein